MTGSLVVEPQDEDAEPLNWEGAGAASSWADLNDAVSADQVDPFEVTFAAAAAGLDTLGAVLNPLDALFEAGVGWLIEHVWFLHEPLDALAGDPTQITAQAQTWHNVAAELGQLAADYRVETGALPAWDGAAAEAYRETVRGFTAALDRTAADAERLSGLILVTGAGVGTVRALIRDTIAKFLGAVLQDALAALAFAVVTAGGSVGTLILTVVVRAIDVADNIARRVSDLLDALSAAGGTAGRLGDAMRDTAAQVSAAAPGLRAAGEGIEQSVDDLHAGKLIESGKQLSGAAQDQRGWSPG
jgi:hypothetical protein